MIYLYGFFILGSQIPWFWSIKIITILDIELSIFFITDMILDMISYDVPTYPDYSKESANFTYFQNVFDEGLSTCDAISGPNIRYIEVIWSFIAHKSGMNKFRVVLSGTQNCADENTAWFVATEKPGIVTECGVSQNATGELKGCLITCKCPCAVCEYLHFRVQILPWMRNTLAVCYFELLNKYKTVDLPLVIVWVNNKKPCEEIDEWRCRAL